jgi:hypothetical protein
MNMTQLIVLGEAKGGNTREGRLQWSPGEGSCFNYLIKIHQHEMQSEQ